MSRMRIVGIIFSLLLLSLSFFSVAAQRGGGNFAPNPSATPTPIPDNDGDGVPNSVDNCPNQAGPSSNLGCPENNGNNGGGNNGGGNNGGGNNGGGNQSPPDTDIDGDGIADSRDNCPTVHGVAENNGCPNTTPDVTPRPRPNLSADTCEVATAGTELVNIRGDESTSNQPIGSLDPYQTYPALGVRGDWVQLVQGGFVFRAVVRLSSACSELDRNSDNNRSMDDFAQTNGNPDVLGDAKCVYFTGLFRNDNASTKALIIELSDAMGEGSSNHIGPALVEPGETYFAERHFLVSEDWQAPVHPSEGWRIITMDELSSDEMNVAKVTHPALLPDFFDFDVVGEVNFLLTVREDCTSPQPVCYHATATVNSNQNLKTPLTYVFALTRDAAPANAESEDSFAFLIMDDFGTALHQEPTPQGQATHQFYILTPWHYDSLEHQGLSLDIFVMGFADEGVQFATVLEVSEVSEVAIESINHLCETNPVELGEAGQGMADGFAPDSEAMVCYYFEQSFLNTTNLPIETPNYQLVVREGSFPHPVFQGLGTPFSKTIFGGGTDKIQYLYYGSDFANNYDVGAEMSGVMPEGLIAVGPEFLMIVDDSYCESGIPPFTHEELLEEEEDSEESGLCYIVTVTYQNVTANPVDVEVQLNHILLDGNEISEVNPIYTNVLTWNAGVYMEYEARFWLEDVPNEGYIGYELNPANLTSNFEIEYGTYHACMLVAQPAAS